ncbi:hypothetical protein SAMN04490220_4346 [Rhodococcus jostii]|uniref:Uncharacterized protein n=1 Tax=Rhodococcus jostii TaxID=132919 RepID=A0A1H5A864_RHOJO|nr:hypothetical protein SAMN04490220_4346 [Rhodococcus jostii]
MLHKSPYIGGQNSIAEVSWSGDGLFSGLIVAAS